MRDDPSLKDKPVIIGHDPRKQGDVVWYQLVIMRLENMVSIQPCLLRKPMNVVPNAVFISGNYSHYREVGMQIR